MFCVNHDQKQKIQLSIETTKRIIGSITSPTLTGVFLLLHFLPTFEHSEFFIRAFLCVQYYISSLLLETFCIITSPNRLPNREPKQSPKRIWIPVFQFSSIQATDALEMLLLSVLSPVLRCDWLLSEWQVALITTVSTGSMQCVHKSSMVNAMSRWSSLACSLDPTCGALGLTSLEDSRSVAIY